jgi:hypothetical protein
MWMRLRGRSDNECSECGEENADGGYHARATYHGLRRKSDV